jgi:hypothetical protein
VPYAHPPSASYRKPDEPPSVTRAWTAASKALYRAWEAEDVRHDTDERDEAMAHMYALLAHLRSLGAIGKKTQHNARPSSATSRLYTLGEPWERRLSSRVSIQGIGFAPRPDF